MALIQRIAAVGMTAAMTMAGCSSDQDSSPDSGPSDVPINELQYIGTHNSYRIQPSDELFEAEKAVVGEIGGDAESFGDIDSWLYTHSPLPEQLADGIRSFELDVWADPDGGLFSDPIAAPFLGVEPAPTPPGMDEPGFKVLHIVDVDTNSTCATFVGCLTEIDDFSEANPEHAPIVILVELKDDPLPEPIDVTEVVAIGPAEMDALDAEIRSVFDDGQLLTPDDVRGDADSVRAAVETDGWPSLEDAAGTVMFVMDNGGSYRTDYLTGHPGLEDRVLFTSDGRDSDDGAVIKVNDPGDGTEIEQLVDAGYMVRTRADADLVRTDERAETALASGAQIVSTDFPGDNINDPGGYELSFDGEVEVRCNPVTSDSSCSLPADL